MRGSPRVTGALPMVIYEYSDRVVEIEPIRGVTLVMENPEGARWVDAGVLRGWNIPAANHEILDSLEREPSQSSPPDELR